MTTPPVVVIKQNKILHAFHHAKATTPQTAQPLDRLGLHDSLVLRRFIARHVVVHTHGDAYYLDQARADAWRHQRRTRVMLVLMVAALAVVFWLVLSG